MIRLVMMKLIFGSATHMPCALTFGNFDGVHLGHQALLKHLKKEAVARALPMVLVLFEPQPEEFFKKEQAPARITSLRDKVSYLKAYDIDAIYCIPFSEHFSRQSASFFVQQVLFVKLNAHYIVLGEDARFGHAREGNVELLQSLASPLNKVAERFPNYVQDNKRISSTAVRHCLQAGQLTDAAVLLGRPYQVSGRVGYGVGRGRTIGFPTANLCVRYKKPALQGVFAVRVTKQDGSSFKGVANWGKRPTFQENPVYHLEVHGIDYHENLYGQYLTVTFLKKIRSECQFVSIQALIDQIHQDLSQAKNYFACEEGHYGITTHD